MKFVVFGEVIMLTVSAFLVFVFVVTVSIEISSTDQMANMIIKDVVLFKLRNFLV